VVVHCCCVLFVLSFDVYCASRLLSSFVVRHVLSVVGFALLAMCYVSLVLSSLCVIWWLCVLIWSSFALLCLVPLACCCVLFVVSCCCFYCCRRPFLCLDCLVFIHFALFCGSVFVVAVVVCCVVCGVCVVVIVVVVVVVVIMCCVLVGLRFVSFVICGCSRLLFGVCRFLFVLSCWSFEVFIVDRCLLFGVCGLLSLHLPS